MNNSLIKYLKEGEVVLFAGAGVSADSPSSLPNWYVMGEDIISSLKKRISLEWKDSENWFSEYIGNIDFKRSSGQFPPAYQAQIINEMCGELYFKALQSFDIDANNSVHELIATLAHSGKLKAIVTTNFDRLIEKSLTKIGVEFKVAFDDQGFEDILKYLQTEHLIPIPIIKVHGCVSDHKSMIDTLKQRELGRSKIINSCLDQLSSGYWLYLGFSGEDLEADENYLGLVNNSSKSKGATYIAYPKNPELREGAKALMKSYGKNAKVEIRFLNDYLKEICDSLKIKINDSKFRDEKIGYKEFLLKLSTWSDNLSLTESGLCLFALFESVGNAEASFRILDKIVRNEYLERDNPEFELAQLNYGRLGAAYGRAINTTDFYGSLSNADEATIQSLMRLKGTDLELAGEGWMCLAWLWKNEGENSTIMAKEVMKRQILNKNKESSVNEKSTLINEYEIDSWISAALVFIINASNETVSSIAATAPIVFKKAIQCGDVVKASRVRAIECLALSRTKQNVPELMIKYGDDFKKAERVGDGFTLGFKNLALGRWYVGPGGLEMIDKGQNKEKISLKAIDFLNKAIDQFEKLLLHPWIIFSQIQLIKAYGDLCMNAECQKYIDIAYNNSDRFPALLSHFYEACYQIQKNSSSNDKAEESLIAAKISASDSGLVYFHETLQHYQ